MFFFRAEWDVGDGGGGGSSLDAMARCGGGWDAIESADVVATWFLWWDMDAMLVDTANFFLMDFLIIASAVDAVTDKEEEEE